MSAMSGAHAHLAKAREFLEAAELEHSQDLYNAATSNAVLSGINSKDAICLKLAGKTKAQYQTTGIAESSARRAIEQATRLYNEAQRIVTS